MLLEIANDRTILDSVKLKEIKSSTHQLKEEILNLLKNLTKEDLERLEVKSKDRRWSVGRRNRIAWRILLAR
jgi:hypothetical protein